MKHTSRHATQILPGLFHWTAFHDDIQQDVHSYYFANADCPILIDPKLPAGGVDWFTDRPKPKHIFLTNRLHYRDSNRFVTRFGVKVWCHRAGLHEFTADQHVQAFEHGDRLPGEVAALEVGALCPEETAFLLPAADGVLALGDSIIREGEDLCFVSDDLMDDPPTTRRGLRRSLRALLIQPFDHLLFAHGEPWIGGGKAALREFLNRAGS